MSFLSSMESDASSLGSNISSDASSLGSDIESAGKSLLNEVDKLEHAYLVKCPSGALGSLMGGASMAAGNLLPGPGGGSIGGEADKMANKYQLGSATASLRQYVTFAFNPASYTISAGATWNEGDVLDKSAGPPTPQFHHTQQRVLTLNDLYLDADTSGDTSISADVDFLMSLCTCNSLSAMIESFVGGGDMAPPFVKFIWGTSMGFLSYVEGMSIEHLMFRPNGQPTRAKVSMTLKEMPTSLLPQNPTSGGREAHGTHTLIEGETLPSIAYSTMRDPNRWRELADENGIDDPMRVEPGRGLMVPSVAPASRGRQG